MWEIAGELPQIWHRKLYDGKSYDNAWVAIDGVQAFNNGIGDFGALICGLLGDVQGRWDR